MYTCTHTHTHTHTQYVLARALFDYYRFVEWEAPVSWVAIHSEVHTNHARIVCMPDLHYHYYYYYYYICIYTYRHIYSI